MKYVYALVFIAHLAMASGGKDGKTPVNGKTENVSNSTASSAISAQMQRGLNASLEQHLARPTIAIAPDAMADLSENLTAATVDRRAQAQQLMSFLDSRPDLMREEIAFEDLTVLPVGFKKKLPDQTVLTVGILEASFVADKALLTLFVRINTPIKNKTSGTASRDLFFGVENVAMNKQSGFRDSNLKVVLLGDYLMPEDKWTIRLKGSQINTAGSPLADDRTYVAFNCGVFDKLNIGADVVFPRSVLLPCDNDGKLLADQNARVELKNMQASLTSGFNDLYFATGTSGTANTMTMGAFALASNPSIAFKVSNLVFDHSDSRSLATMRFHSQYEGDRDEKWKGLYINAMDVILPEEFQDDAGNRLTITGDNVMLNKTGFSGIVGATNIGKSVNMNKWKLKLKSIHFSLAQNKLVGGGFEGGLETPLHASNAATSELLDIKAIISEEVIANQSTFTYAASVDLRKELPLNFMFAKATIEEGSFIDFTITTVNNKRSFKARASLTGSLQMGFKKTGATAYEKDKITDLRGLRFVNMVIQPDAPQFSVGYFQYTASDSSRFANFPVKLLAFEKVTSFLGDTAPQDETWTSVGLSMSLLNGKIGGSTAFAIKSKYDDATGKLTPVGVKMAKVSVNGAMAGFSFDGMIEAYESTTAKYIQGMANVTVDNPGFTAGFNMVVGRMKTGGSTGTGYGFGFIDGMAELGSGVTVGPIEIYGAGMGTYWNMKQLSSLDSAAAGALVFNFSNQLMKYTPDYATPLGLKLMASIRNPGGSNGGSKSLYAARVFFDFALSRTYGISYVSVYGYGVVAGSLTNDDKDAQKSAAKTIFQKAKQFVVGAGTADSQVESSKKAKELAKDVVGTDLSSLGIVSFTAGLRLDVPAKTLHLEAEVFLKAGDLVGIGPNSRLGRAEMHFEQSNTYIYIGRVEKQNRVGIRYGNFIAMDAYLMAGKGVPQFPAPDPIIMSYFPQIGSRFSAPVCSAISDGNAFALGASVRLFLNKEIGKTKMAIGGIAGLDLMMRQNETPLCVGASEWAGQGQFYAAAKINVSYNNISFANVGAGIYAKVSGPKPFGGSCTVGLVVPSWVDKDRIRNVSFEFGTGCPNNVTTCSN